MTLDLEYQFASLHEQTKGFLLAVKPIRKIDLTDEQTDVFTRLNVCTHYMLNDDKYIMLVMLGEKYIPYTVLVPYTDEQYEFYNSNKHTVFDINIKNKESKTLNLRRRK